MKNLTPILLAGLLTLGSVACEDNTAKTSSSAPNTTEGTTNLEKPKAATSQDDATSEVRRKQLNSDVRAREERSEVTGSKADSDLASQVRSKLEANLPNSALTVSSTEGAVKVAGTIVDNANLAKIEPLAKEITGVKSVTVDVKVDPNAKPAAPAPGSDQPIKEQTNKQ